MYQANLPDILAKSTLPHTMQIRLSFEHGAILDGLPGWREVFMLPVDERMRALIPRALGCSEVQACRSTRETRTPC